MWFVPMLRCGKNMKQVSVRKVLSRPMAKLRQASTGGAATMVMNSQQTSSGRMSMRKSVLVWIAGMFLGWGIAVVLVYQLIRTSRVDVTAEAPLVADRQAEEMSKITPAAGDPVQQKAPPAKGQ
jgi:hypothetical protein